MSVRIQTKGIEVFQKYLEILPGQTREAARIAINDVARQEGRKLIIDRMNQEVAFPAGYVDQTRLQLKQLATNSRLEAMIEARQRPTSLARFSSGGVLRARNQNIRIQVKRGGGGRTTTRAFLIPLRSGRSLTLDNYNIGLAVRVEDGQTITRSRAAVRIFPNVYLLYGPSVDQVFQTVADDLNSPIGDLVVREFNRQFDRLAGAA